MADEILISFIAVLLAVICFLLYKLYRIKYTIPRGEGGIIPESWKREMMNLESDSGKELDMRFEEIDSRISDLEGKVRKNEKIVERLAEELS